MVTVGSQMALDLTTRIFIDPGDVILAEAPSYVGALGTFQSVPGAGRARRDGRRRADPGSAGRGDRGVRGRRPPDQAAVHDPELPQPGRRHPVRRPARRHRRDLPAGRHRDPRGQPLRAAGFRRQAAAGDPGRRCRERHLPRVVLQDIRPGPAGRLGARAARGAGEAGAGQRVRDAQPAGVQSNADLPVPGEVRLAQPDQGLPADLRRAPRRDARRAGGRTCREGTTWTHPDGGFYVWVTLPEGLRRRRDAAPRGHRPRRLRARNCLLRRRSRVPAAAAVVLLPDLGAHRRGGAPAGRACWTASST